MRSCRRKYWAKRRESGGASESETLRERQRCKNTENDSKSSYVETAKEVYV